MTCECMVIPDECVMATNLAGWSEMGDYVIGEGLALGMWQASL